MTRPLRFGLVGTGHWAQITHAPAPASTDGIEFAAIWGRNSGAAGELAGRLHATAYDDISAFLANVDAVAFIPARPSSFPVTFPDGTRRRRNVLNDGAPPAICGHPQIFAAPYSDSGRSLLSDLGSNTEASSPVSHASRTALRDGGLPPAQAGSRALRSRNPGPRSARGEAGLRRRWCRGSRHTAGQSRLRLHRQR